MTGSWQLIGSALSWWEWMALAWFFVCWIGYARFAKRHATMQPSLLAEGNRERRLWMLQSTRREVRVIDGVVGLAAESFNDGLRGYYFVFAAAAWLVSPLAFALASAGVVWVLYKREFHCEALRLMRP
jgi:uncharacterized membrane protein